VWGDYLSAWGDYCFAAQPIGGIEGDIPRKSVDPPAQYFQTQNSQPLGGDLFNVQGLIMRRSSKPDWFYCYWTNAE
jgi:hypothetical protein